MVVIVMTVSVASAAVHSRRRAPDVRRIRMHEVRRRPRHRDARSRVLRVDRCRKRVKGQFRVRSTCERQAETSSRGRRRVGFWVNRFGFFDVEARGAVSWRVVNVDMVIARTTTVVDFFGEWR